MRTFLVRLPSGKRYWSVVDEQFELVAPTDRFLRHVRFGRDNAESTTKAYAGALVLLLRWCTATGRDWRSVSSDMASFIVWLRYTPARVGDEVLRAGPGSPPVRSAGRVNLILVAVRAFLLFAVTRGEVSQQVVDQLYDVEDAADLPAEVFGENPPRYRLAARHRLRESKPAVPRFSDEQIVAMVKAAGSARDMAVLLLMARAGLRRGEVTGLRRSDMHLLVDSARLGCRLEGAHVHVVPRDNVNGACAKGRDARAVPLDRLVVQALDLYAGERERCRPAQSSDFLFVNLFRTPVGAPMRPGAVNELVTGAARRAGLTGRATPHMARHAFASNVMDAGGTPDELQELLGHASARSSDVYRHPDPRRLRAAVDRVQPLGSLPGGSR